MYHSITFGDKNTWDDWHLIPSSRPVFSVPAVNTSYIEIPGMDGQLDATEALTGYPTFADRTGSFEFVVVEGDGYGSWMDRYTTIMEYLHGRRMHAVLEDEPDYYYDGRFSVNSWKSGSNWSTVAIDYTVAPYKKELTSSLDDWEWDSFNFESGIIRSLKDLTVDGSLTVNIIGTPQPVTPEFTASSAMTVTFKGNEYALSAGTTKLAKVILQNGENELTISGNGTVSINYRGGRL